jgi:hypothetical protein
MKAIIKWTLYFLMISSTALSQRVVEGKIVDKATGAPIPFASIVVGRTSAGTTANLDGEFSLLIPDTASIKVTCIGYETQQIRSFEKMKLVQLKSVALQLTTVYVYDKKVNPKRVVRQAFANMSDNYDQKAFLQKFFYRHYTKNDSVYEKLIEASVDVWKNQGYHQARRSVGENEELRVTQLRRSLDIKGMVQGQTPISIDFVLQADPVGYQSLAQNGKLQFVEGASTLKTDFHKYTFTFDGITNYDGLEVYKIQYSHIGDSIKTTLGYKRSPEISGTLFITVDTYAIVKAEETRTDGINSIQSSAFYRKHQGKYYPYHFIREGQNHFFEGTTRSYHIELMSVEVRQGEHERFAGQGMRREDLLNIPYDSSFWNNSTILRATPLENDIINGLGGGLSLNKQFFLYKQYELNVTDGGKNAVSKFNWLSDNSKGKRILYICFWNNDFKNYLADLEYFKRLNLLYNNKITFVLISVADDDTAWQQLLTKYNYFSDGIINYRIGGASEIARRFDLKKIPSFVLIARDGSVFDLTAKSPKDPKLENDFKFLITQEDLK